MTTALPRAFTRVNCRAGALGAPRPLHDGANRYSEKEVPMGFRRRTRRRALIAGAAVARHRDNKMYEQQQAPVDDSQYAAPPPPPAPPPATSADEIEHLAQLHASGALTDEEFAAAKAQIIGA